MGFAILLVLIAGVACGIRGFVAGLPPGTEPTPRLLLTPPPVATLVGLVVIGTVSTLQLTVAPGLLTALERDADQVADGQVWRLATALLVQDGGVAGAVSNLVFLALLGTFAERLLGHGRAVAAWCCGALAGELAGLAWQPVGGGNSVGNFGLAGALAVVTLMADWRMHVLPAGIVLAGTAVLLLGHDIHGVAATAGALAGLVMVLLARRRGWSAAPL